MVPEFVEPDIAITVCWRSDTAFIDPLFVGLVTLSVAVPSISRVEFGAVSGFLGSSVVADNFYFTPQGVPVSAPGPLLLFVLGLGGGRRFADARLQN